MDIGHLTDGISFFLLFLENVIMYYVSNKIMVVFKVALLYQMYHTHGNVL